MKRYEYKGKIYCDEDISEETENYGGDLCDLGWDLHKDGKIEEYTCYYVEGKNTSYESYEDIVENEFGDLEVKE